MYLIWQFKEPCWSFHQLKIKLKVRFYSIFFQNDFPGEDPRTSATTGCIPYPYILRYLPPPPPNNGLKVKLMAPLESAWWFNNWIRYSHSATKGRPPPLLLYFYYTVLTTFAVTGGVGNWNMVGGEGRGSEATARLGSWPSRTGSTCLCYFYNRN